MFSVCSAVRAVQWSRQPAIWRSGGVQCLHAGSSERGRFYTSHATNASQVDGLLLLNERLRGYKVVNTWRRHFSARPGRTDAWISQLADGGESNTSNDTWDLHTSLPVPRPGHKTPIPSTRDQTQYQQPTGLHR